MLKRKTVGVLGLGIFGRTVARELSNFDQDVIAIDIRESHVKEVADLVTKAAVGDITDKEFLLAVGIEHCDTVVIASGNNLESSVLAVMHCKKLGVPTIIAKAKNKILKKFYMVSEQLKSSLLNVIPENVLLQTFSDDILKASSIWNMVFR